MLEASYEDPGDFLARTGNFFAERGLFFVETVEFDQPLGVDVQIRMSFRSPARLFSVHGRVLWRRARAGTSKGQRLPVGVEIELVRGHEDDLEALFSFLGVPMPNGLNGPSPARRMLKVAFEDAQAVLDFLEDLDGNPRLFVPTKVAVEDRLRLVLRINYPTRIFSMDVRVQEREVVKWTERGRVEGVVVELEATRGTFPYGREAFLAFLASQRPRGLPA